MLNASNCENGLIKLMTVANGMYIVNNYNTMLCSVYTTIAGEYCGPQCIYIILMLFLCSHSAIPC